MTRSDHRDVGSSEAAFPRSDSAQAPARSLRARAATSEQQIDLEGLTIDRAGEIPIGVQLAWALRARIGDGRLAPGRRLPGLRELADMLGINANTARAVYQRLEQEGLIDSRQGTGTFVASVAPEPSAVGQIAADAARQARRTGVDPREVAAALYVTQEPPADTTAQATTRDTERRRELRAQIAALEQALSEIQACHPGLIPTPIRSLMRAGPRLLSAQELQQVRTQLVRRLAAAEPLLDAPAESDQAPAKSSQSTTQRATGATKRTIDSKQPPRPRPSTRPSPA